MTQSYHTRHEGPRTREGQLAAVFVAALTLTMVICFAAGIVK